jgi:hypothetical protein
MPLINDEEFQRPNDVFRPSPFNDVGSGMAFDPNQTGVEYAHSEVDTPEPEGFVMEGAIGEEQIADGAVTPRTIDATPPAVPTGLALSSQVATDADGRSALVLLVDVVQPADTDLYGTWVEITGTAGPDFTYARSVFIPGSAGRVVIDGVLGNTQYWARARSVDIQGNLSAFTAVETATTGKDTVAPGVPEGLTVSAGYRGFMANWTPRTEQDLMFVQVRYAPDDGTGLAPDTALWTYVQVRTSGIFISNLDPSILYWVQVRAVDFSGNVQTSEAVTTAVDFTANPEAGWTALVSVQPTLIGAVDVAFNSVLTSILAANAINADDILAGTFRVSPLDTDAEGIEILAADLTVIGRWDENGLRIVDPVDPSRYLLIQSGEIRFTTDDGATFPLAITPEGINASAINFGEMPGGHNLVLNSSFELADFAAAASTLTFTDATQWVLANRVTAPDNVSESTSLTMTAPGYV